jgi:hypothetical protein
MKVILFTTLFLFSINGFAFNWEFVVKSKDGDTFYIDIDNIKKHKGLVYYWSMVDLLEPFPSGTNSFIDKSKVDCIEGKRTWFSSTSYSQSMGKGRIIIEDNTNRITYPKPNTMAYILMKFACKNAR